MLITRVSIRNFRCITEIGFAAGATTVLIGENNVGKTATLDAIKLALGRRWGRSGNTGFNEYDFRSVLNEGVRTYLPIEIRLDLAETPASQWPQEIKDELVSVINTDPVTGESAITLRVTCKMDEFTKELDPSWEFLNPDGQPFAGAGARNQNLSSFFDYVPFYSMAALRDASSEFSPRSKLWAALLKTIEVDRAKTEELEAKFAQLNDELLAADPKLEGIKNTLRAISQVVASGAAGQVDVRAVPTNLWEILGKAELVVQGHPVDPWLPITRHGNGVQSLAVIFLFRAFVENALAETMRAESEPVLALEEPESHLHPQASRSLWKSISVLPGQKFVTTHSPYFAQNVPFDQIVLLRREGQSTAAVAIPRSFEIEIEANDALKTEIEKLGNGISYREDAKRLIGTRQLSTDEFRGMLKCYTAPGSQPNHAKLREFYEEGRRYISSESLAKLESFSRRIRGEIFFARKWLLCEGQSDYAVLTAAAEVLGCPTDSRSVAVIDYQNNGSAGVFATAARALGMPWALICDGDQGGDDHLSQLTTMNFSAREIGDHTVQLPKGVCLEGLLVKSGVRALMLQAVHDLDPDIPDDDTAIVTFAEAHKEEVATRLAARMRVSTVPADLPNEVRQVFEKLGETEANEPAAA